MRPAVLPTFALLVFALVPTVTAQDPRPAVVEDLAIIHDPVGDVELRSPAANQPVPQEPFQHVDVLAAWVGNQTLSTIEFGIAFKRLDPPTTYPSRTASLRFRLDENRYSIDFSPTATTCGATLRQWKGTAWESSRCFDVQREAQKGTLRTLVPRSYLLNRTQVPFQNGMDLTEIYSIATVSGFGSVPNCASCVNATDRAPNQGFGSPLRSIAISGEQTGNLYLTTPEPLRVSNGESTTMVFKGLLTNRGERGDRVQLRVENPHDAWRVRVPALLDAPAGSTVAFPIILTMEFTHEHGRTQYFTVAAESTLNAGVLATLLLGVEFLEIPQPAGHHDRLWLHSAPVADGSLDALDTWMNAVEKDPRPGTTDAPTRPRQSNGPSYTQNKPAWFMWDFPLKPELRMGIDFDLSRNGSVTVPIILQQASSSVVVGATLVHCDPSGRNAGTVPGFYSSYRCGENGRYWPVAAGRSAPAAIVSGERRLFQLALKPNETADLIPYQKDAKLALLVDVAVDGAAGLFGANGVKLDPSGAILILPLNEYHDPVDQTFRNVGEIEVRPRGAPERELNAGRGSLFPFLLVNNGSTPHRVRLEVEGTNAEWARFAEGPRVSVPAQSKARLTVVVNAPEDAQPGERAELFVVVMSEDDPNVVAVSRLRATVVDTALKDIPHEAPNTEETARSLPNIGAPTLAVGAAAAAAVASRASRTSRRRE